MRSNPSTNLIELVRVLEKIESSPQKKSKYESTMDGSDKNGNPIVIEF